MFAESTATFLRDFGVPVTAGGVTGVGLLDMPSEVIADGMVLSTGYSLMARTADFGGLQRGDAVTVGGVAYTCREVRLVDDGVFCNVALTKV